LLAKLQLDHVLSPRDPKKQRKAFQTVPKTLELAYNEVMQRIESSERSGDKALALKIFSWLYRAMRNLSMDELLDVLAVDVDNDVSDDDQLESGDSTLNTNSDSDSSSDSELGEGGERHLNLGKLQPTDVVESCKGLVLHEPSGLVRFIHDTVRVFIGKNLKSELPSEIHLAKACLTYLMLPEFEQRCIDNDSMEKRRANYKFCLYAAQFWGFHVGKVENLPVVQKAAITFLAHPNKRASMLQMEEYAKWSNVHVPDDDDTLLHVIVKNGLVTICRLVLYGGSNTDDRYVFAGSTQRSNDNRTLSRIPILSTLQTTETDLTAKTVNEETPLSFAAELGHKEMIQLLLDQGADVNESGGFFGNALQTASKNGHLTVVQLLLNHGADVNASGGRFYGNALQAASAEGHEMIVQLLLDQGTDINVSGKFYSNLSVRSYCTSLEAPSASGHLIQLLLNRGADINAMGIHRSVLQSASASSHESVVQLLLNQGAYAMGPSYNTSMGPEYSTALQAASANGHLIVVQLLLNQGANANASGGFYGNALQAALANGHESVAILLLDQGADINATGGYYRSALGAASAYGHEVMIRLQKKHMTR
jgi:ankyrin repeat protein